MRDRMEDTLIEDSMMDCNGDSAALNDLVNLATNISDSSATIRDAAERLLSLLGVEDSEDDFLSSSSEDEGVDLDDDNDENEDTDVNTRLLHELAASLAEELKYSTSSSSSSNNSTSKCDSSSDNVEKMEIVPNVNDNQSELNQFQLNYFNVNINAVDINVKQLESELVLSKKKCKEGEHFGKWTEGWDACSAEAVRYLLEDEGLSPNHPFVLALKNHLESQRINICNQYLT